MTNSNDISLRPRDLATLVLASGDALPRQRARDQQADLAGSELMHRVLTRLVELDPEAQELPVALEQIVCELGEPTGPARAIALVFQQEFASAAANPDLVVWLIERAAARP
jgi:hypothetical protein